MQHLIDSFLSYFSSRFSIFKSFPLPRSIVTFPQQFCIVKARAQILIECLYRALIQVQERCCNTRTAVRTALIVQASIQRITRNTAMGVHRWRILHHTHIWYQARTRFVLRVVSKPSSVPQSPKIRRPRSCSVFCKCLPLALVGLLTAAMTSGVFIYTIGFLNVGSSET